MLCQKTHGNLCSLSPRKTHVHPFPFYFQLSPSTTGLRTQLGAPLLTMVQRTNSCIWLYRRAHTGIKRSAPLPAKALGSPRAGTRPRRPAPGQRRFLGPPNRPPRAASQALPAPHPRRPRPQGASAAPPNPKGGPGGPAGTPVPQPRVSPGTAALSRP